MDIITFSLWVNKMLLGLRPNLRLISAKGKFSHNWNSIATGKLSKTQGRPRCKIVNILFADTNDCFDEVREAIINNLPIIVVRGSDLCN